MNMNVASALALVLASSASLAQPAQKKNNFFSSEHAQRVRRIAEDLGARRAELELGQSDALLPVRSWVDPQGTSVARFNQTHEGYRVFGAELVASMSPGGVQTLGRALESRIELAGRPLLSEEQARLVSHRELLPRGPYAALPSVELVVFPTRFTGGLRPKIDAQGKVSWDRENSVLAPRPQGTHVWAYEVVSLLNNREDGVRELHVVVDARTGNVLRKWDAATSMRPRSQDRSPRTYGDLQQAKAPLRIVPAFVSQQVAASLQTAATGTGHSQYSGDVLLSTSANPAGGYDLEDPTRAVSPNKVWLTSGIVTNYFNILQPGLVAVPYTMSNQAGSLDDTWGDGRNYHAPPPNQPSGYYTPAIFHWGDANGQTAAVDAHFAASATYDMYKNVLGRLGLDGPTRASSRSCTIATSTTTPPGSIPCRRWSTATARTRTAAASRT